MLRLPGINRGSRRIREAIDSYPGGICFAYPNGMTILVNPVMNRLGYLLTGQTILNANQTWEQLLDPGFSLKNGRRLSRHFEPFSTQETWPVFELEDGSVWQINQQLLDIDGVLLYQYIAENVTELYNVSKQLFDANRKTKSFHEQQRRLLKNIAKTNEEKERLRAKIRIHDNFGRCLIASRNLLASEFTADSPQSKELLDAWEKTIAGMQNLSHNQEVSDLPSPREELVRVAELIGCKVEIQGEEPGERTPLLLMYAAIREALTNAVRHAGADCLMVNIEHGEKDYHVVIRDNGLVPADTVKEGGGLSNLRKRLELEGAKMEIRCEAGVVMELKLPKG